MIFVGAAPALENNTVRLFVFHGRTTSFWIYERSLNFAGSNEMSLSITLVLNDTMYVSVFVIRKLKSLSLSLFGVDIGYGNKLVRLRQGDEIKQDSKGTRSSFKFISQQCFYYFFCLHCQLFIRILPSVLFLPMTIDLSTSSFKNNNKHYHITYNYRTFLSVFYRGGKWKHVLKNCSKTFNYA